MPPTTLNSEEPHKLLIAAVTLGGAALFAWIVLRVSKRVYNEMRWG